MFSFFSGAKQIKDIIDLTKRELGQLSDMVREGIATSKADVKQLSDKLEVIRSNVDQEKLDLVAEVASLITALEQRVNEVFERVNDLEKRIVARETKHNKVV